MFSGLIEAQGRVRSVQRNKTHLQLSLDLGTFSELLDVGESLAVDGVCMTVQHIEKGTVYFDVLPATIEKTTISSFFENRTVNLERPLAFNGRLGGHIVQGHVDGRGVVASIDNTSGIIKITLEKELHTHCIEGGSIAINGVSLTIAKLHATLIEIHLIPETLSRTNLSELKEDESVNIECDVLSRYATHQNTVGREEIGAPLGSESGTFVADRVAIQKVGNCLEAIRQGEMIIIFDEATRENEGDFFVPAQRVTAKDVTFMAKKGSGLICAPISADIAKSLDLFPMTSDNTSLHNTMYTISVDARKGTKTGISSEERAHCMRLLGDPQSRAEDFVKPGHIFPLLANSGGLKKRQGHTEAAIFLAEAAGYTAAGVICEILDEQGNPMRFKELQAFAKKHHMHLISIADMLAYQRAISE